ncbi:glycerophosphodiester phosphodiesterase family protein [Chitinophaga sp. MM2321]|uniref:glycerophosphodiester phosphodiesterase n=1 Tax=Chitinophaga sp. MM2321 TaxID=3137178 RepID=UPI0032D5916A
MKLQLKSLALFAMLFICSNVIMAQKNFTTKVIAHRGAWKAQHLPENSLASLRHAGEIGCYGSEFDIHITKDDIIVVNHDNEYYGLTIATSTYQELLAKKHSNGESIPTLEEYLKEGMKHKKTRLVCEIKTSTGGKERTKKLVEMTVAIVKKAKARKQVDYITFDLEGGKLLAKLAPKNEVAYLTGDLTPAEAKAAGFNGIDYHYNVYVKNPGWIEEAKKLGLSVNVWTVNTEDIMQKFIQQKVDFITTNEPELLFSELKATL